MNQLVPLTNDPNQNLVAPLSVDGLIQDMFLTLRFNEAAQYWVMTVSDVQGNLILDSVPFITGNAPAGNILGQFAYLGIGSAYIINASAVAAPDFPNSVDLGSDFVLIWGDTPAVVETQGIPFSGAAITSIQIINIVEGLVIEVIIKLTESGFNTGDNAVLSGLSAVPALNGVQLNNLTTLGNQIEATVAHLAVPDQGPEPETGFATLVA